MPKLRFPGWPGGDELTATLTSVGGTGTPASSYTMTVVGTRSYEIDIDSTLVGAFELLADGGGIAAFVVTLTGSDVDVSAVGNLPTPLNATQTKAAVRDAMTGRWTNAGTGADYDDITIADTPE